MKKLSFFLMAMLFAVMSFAQDAPIYELVPASGSNNSYAGNCDITIDGIKWNLTGNSTMQPWRIGGKSITNQDRALYSKTPLAYNIDKIEVIHGTASGITVNSFKLIISDAANGAGETIDVAFKASATTTIDLPEGDYTNKYFKFLYNVTNSTDNNKFVQFTGAKFYAALAADDVKAPIIKGAEDFISETEVTIEAEDDVTVYYTLDGTEPTTASTVYAAPFTVKETTTVKAVAYRGEKASFVTSATFTQATRVTAAEAAELAMKVASNNALTSVTYVINAYVTSVIDQTLSSGQQRFWVADTKDGGQVLQSYYCNVPQVLKVGDYIQMFGKLTKYNTSPQMKNGDVTILPAPVAKFNVIVTATAEGEDVVTGGGEYEEGEEVTVTASEDLEGWVFIGWTEDGEFVANDPEYTFVVKGDVELVAVYAMNLGENKVTDLVIDGDNMLLTGSVSGFPMGTMNLELALGEYDDEEGVYLLTEESKLYVGETNFTFVDGMAAVDMSTNSAMAMVVFEHNGAYYYMTINMSKKKEKIEATVIEIDNAIVTIEERSMGFGDEVYHVLKMESTWNDGETTYPVSLETTEFDQTKESQEVAASITVGGMGDEDPWLGNAEGDVTITVANGVVTVEGLLENAYAWPAPIAFDLTISGTLPNSTPDDGGETPANVTFDFTTKEGLEALGIAYPTTDAGNGACSTDLEEGKAYSQNGISLTAKYGSTATRIWLASSGKMDLRHYKGGVLTFAAPAGKVITNIVFDGADVSGLTTLVDKAWTGNASTVEIPAAADAKTIKINTITVHVADASSDYVATPTISGEADFLENTTVTITAEEGLEVYYTLDGTDPTKASTKYTAPFELTATTTVKAIAYNGDKASAVVEKTFTKMTILTCAEAVALCTETVTAEKHIIRGYLTEYQEEYNAQYKNMTFWMADATDGGKVLLAYRVKPLTETEQTLKVGDFVEVVGNLILYGETPEVNAGGTVELITAAETAVENITLENKAMKIIENGQIVILKNGVRYNILGAVVK